MTGALIILLATLVTGAVLYAWHRYDMKRNGGEEPVVEEPERPEGCCGQHAVCEKESLLAFIDNEVVYYEDEELDAYIGKLPEDYTDEQIEQFRDVFYTLRQDEVAGWARSLNLRGILLPAIIQEELLMALSEQRANAQKTEE